MVEQERAPEYSVIVPVGARVDELSELMSEYLSAFRAVGVTFELITVFDGQKDLANAFLQTSVARDELVRVIELSQYFGESAALMAGFDHARGERLVTMPAYYQVDPNEVKTLLASEEVNDDMLIAVRSRRAGSLFDKGRRRAFHWLFQFVSRMRFRDLGCGVRLLRREVASEICLYGDQHRFLPALASQRGFHVREIELSQSPKDHFRGRYRIREYLHRLLDIVTVFFLVRFTKKPLRFFGTIGFFAASFGGLVVAVLVVQRLFFDMALADRPALLLGSLLVVLGVQVLAIGLVGELIIFTHASQMREYAIRSVRQSADTADDEVPEDAPGSSEQRVGA